MHQVQVNVVPRETGKKTELKRIRAQGLVPANVYGRGIATQACALNEKELRKAFGNDLEANLIVELQSSSKELNGKKCVLKSIDRTPLWAMTHVDLYQIDMNRPLSARIPLHFVGVPEGVKTDGGILQIIRRAVQIEALPGDLPDFIEVDVTEIKLNQTLHVGEIKVSDKVKVLDSSEFALLSVTEPEKEEVAAPAAAGEGAATAPGTGEGAATAAATAAEVKK
jgi:large subunit ribosomal protein L25